MKKKKKLKDWLKEDEKDAKRREEQEQRIEDSYWTKKYDAAGRLTIGGRVMPTVNPDEMD